MKHLPLTPALYRRLKERGVLSTDQIGEIELEDSLDFKVSKLLSFLKNEDGSGFASFCKVLHELGYQSLAEALHAAVLESEQIQSSGKTLSNKKILKVLLLHPKDNGIMKEENKRLMQKIQSLKSKYLANLEQLEERLALVRWQKDLTVKERNITMSENEELQNLNHELQALIRRLQSSTIKVPLKDLGLSVDFLPVKASRAERVKHLGLFFREGL
ncbi:uncharacterized protein LOC115462273 isoform X2 [Microcaecilia unicolor]|nr:uncharacterized protein LOC115462273 isoform X2 [Microcaecilia unicolor]